MDQLIRASGIKFMAPFYHTVSDRRLPHISPIYPVVSPQQFEKDVEFLAKHFDFIDSAELLKYTVQGFPSDRKTAFLSFDDGLKECTLIADILKRKGIPACFFVNPSFIDSEEVFFRYKVGLILDRMQNGNMLITEKNELKVTLSEKGLLRRNLDSTLRQLRSEHDDLIDEMLELLNLSIDNKAIYMSSSQISQLANDGFDIGGHSMNHPYFGDLALREQLKQIGESVGFCQKNFHQKLRLFAFPFYDFDLPVKLFEQMQNELEIDLSFGTSGLKSELFSHHYQRLEMERKSKSSSDYLKYQLGMAVWKKWLGKDLMVRS